jgi:hypothetical protein
MKGTDEKQQHGKSIDCRRIDATDDADDITHDMYTMI